MVIKSENDIDYGLLRVKKPYQVNETVHVLDICYAADALLLQTTTCVIPYSYNIFDSGMFQIDVVSNDTALKYVIDNINQYIIQKLKRYNPLMLANKTYIDYLKIIKLLDFNTEFRLRFRNPHVDNVTLFDNQNNIIATKGLSTFDRVVCLFQIQKLIVQKDSYYFQASVVQIKKMNQPLAIPRTCLIDTLPDIEDVIQQKTVIKHVAPKAPPLPPPLPPPTRGVHNPPQYVRKVVEKRTTIEPTIIGFKAPTLDEILKARTNLKSINNILNLN